MITFSFAFLGFEDRILDAAITIAPALDMTIGDAVTLVHNAIDVDQEVVLQTSDVAFGRLMSSLDLAVDEDGGLDWEVMVLHIESEPAIYTINTCPRLPTRPDLGPVMAPRTWG